MTARVFIHYHCFASKHNINNTYIEYQNFIPKFIVTVLPFLMTKGEIHLNFNNQIFCIITFINFGLELVCKLLICISSCRAANLDILSYCTPHLFLD
jgi:hypothetical protein